MTSFMDMALEQARGAGRRGEVPVGCVLVQRGGSEEGRARNEAEADGYGPPRRPRRGYHGKRDFKLREE